jgi:hypothetical protein
MGFFEPPRIAETAQVSCIKVRLEQQNLASSPPNLFVKIRALAPTVQSARDPKRYRPKTVRLRQEL